jgi:hypothetical protein
MTLMSEGLAALRGCLRIVRGDPLWFEDFNVTIEGFWRSFAVIIPQGIMAYPHFISLNRQLADYAIQQNLEAPSVDLGRDYLFLVAFLVLWPVVAAILTRVLGVSTNYARYVIVYNWMSLPVMAIALVPSLLYLAQIIGFEAASFSGLPILGVGLILSWIVARRALETTAVVAIAFALADFALTQGLFTLIGG